MSERDSHFQQTGDPGRGAVSPDVVLAFRRAADRMADDELHPHERAGQAWSEIEHVESDDLPPHMTSAWDRLKDKMKGISPRLKSDIDEQAREDGVQAADDINRFLYDLNPHGMAM